MRTTTASRLDWLHRQIVYFGSAVTCAFLATVFSNPAAQEPSVFVVEQVEGQACLVDETTGAYAAVLEGQPVCWSEPTPGESFKR